MNIRCTRIFSLTQTVARWARAPGLDGHVESLQMVSTRWPARLGGGWIVLAHDGQVSNLGPMMSHDVPRGVNGSNGSNGEQQIGGLPEIDRERMPDQPARLASKAPRGPRQLATPPGNGRGKLESFDYVVGAGGSRAGLGKERA